MDKDRFKQPPTPSYTPRNATPAIQPLLNSPPAPTTPASVQIDIRLPKLNLHRLKAPRVAIPPTLITHRKRVGVSLAAFAAIAVIGFSAQGALNDSSKKGLTAGIGSSTQGTTQAAGTAIATSAAPTFSPLAPKDKPQLATGAEGATAYDGTRDSYSYTDMIQGTAFTVSQQPLPDKYGSKEAAVAKAAKSVSAKIELNTVFGKAYLANDAKSNVQIIVFASDDVLVFIQSAFPHGNDSWIQYIASLESV